MGQTRRFGGDWGQEGARIGDRAGSYVHILIWGVTRQQFNSLSLPLAPSLTGDGDGGRPPHETTRWFPWRPWNTPAAGPVQRARLSSDCSGNKPMVRPSLALALALGTGLRWSQHDMLRLWVVTLARRRPDRALQSPPSWLFGALSQLLARSQSWRFGLYVPQAPTPTPVHFLLLILGACPSGAKEAKSQKSQTSTGSNFARNNPFPPVWTPFHQAASSDWAQILQMALIPRVPAADSLTGSMMQSLSGTWP
ncbi:hypothetical protein PABG_06240 [Paracoccidioides brasiliensis Pb03]|nr:hypothetical protein PABG_06240 [Paracoccidioides brasiliensis Pb03]